MPGLWPQSCLPVYWLSRANHRLAFRACWALLLPGKAPSLSRPLSGPVESLLVSLALVGFLLLLEELRLRNSQEAPGELWTSCSVFPLHWWTHSHTFWGVHCERHILKAFPGLPHWQAPNPTLFPWPACSGTFMFIFLPLHSEYELRGTGLCFVHSSGPHRA